MGAEDMVVIALDCEMDWAAEYFPARALTVHLISLMLGLMMTIICEISRLMYEASSADAHVI
jgi:hypothetical protein